MPEDTFDISQTTHRPWEHKTIEKLTLAEVVHWVHWYTKGRTGPVVFDPETVVHNILLWERRRVEMLSQNGRQDSSPTA